ncbi:MAG: hypothetical protein P8177_07120 [Gemmatimonadota bacterium]|jgi:hypothetical protein
MPRALLAAFLAAAVLTLTPSPVSAQRARTAVRATVVAPPPLPSIPAGLARAHTPTPGAVPPAVGVRDGEPWTVAVQVGPEPAAADPSRESLAPAPGGMPALRRRGPAGVMTVRVVIARY